MQNKIYFVVPKIPERIDRLLKSGQPFPSPESLAPSRPPWRGAQWSWIIQTFLYMRQAGLNVELVDVLVENEICVVHYDTFGDRVWGANSFIVGIRADNPPFHRREIEIVQSPANLGSNSTFLVNHWPQPNLIPRDPARKNHVSKISYFGGEGGMSSKYFQPVVVSALDKLEIILDPCFDTTRWNNYEDTDLVIAVRNHHHPLLINTKPASKLVNTWRAGCVALLGNEPAYRAAGSPGQDYFEINSPADMLRVVTCLKQSPEIYQKVREAGISKSKEFDFEAIQQRWIELFLGPIAETYIEWQANKNDTSRFIRRYGQSIRQWTDDKLFKIPVRSKTLIENWKIKCSL